MSFAPLLLAAKLALASAPPASPLLPPDHWSVAAAERLHEVGLAPDWFPAQRAAPLIAVAQTLAAAAARAERDAPAYAPLARAWAERFAQEFPHAAAPPVPLLHLLSAQATAGFATGSFRELRGPPAIPPAALHFQGPGSMPFLGGNLAAALGSHLAASVSAPLSPRTFDLPGSTTGGELVGALGPVALSVGRAPLRYGPNEIGAVVAGGAIVDRIELMTTAPVRLPGPLDLLGDFALDLAVARFDELRHPYHPLLWDMQLSWRPHPRLTLAAIRGVMFGGALWDGIPVHDAPLALLGIKNYRENNVYSGSVQLRLPTERLLPLTAKLEWGTDDNPGAAFSWPGLVAGLSAPMLPGLPAALGLEYAYFGRGPFGYHDPFPWYSHGQYVGGWATDQRPLGDPLGGNGRAFRLTAAADPWSGLLRLAAVAFLQDRFADNLYAPQAGGHSVGGRGEAELRLGRYAFAASGGYERGDQGWHRGELALTASAFF
jgi:Capsule assembly protein Wzi